MKKRPTPKLGTSGDVIRHRVLAHVIDSVLMGPIWGVAVIAGTALGDTGSLLLVFAGVVATLVYGFLLEGLCGYTPGTCLLGLVVVTSDGSTCTVGASILRNLLWIVDALPTAASARATHPSRLPVGASEGTPSGRSDENRSRIIACIGRRRDSVETPSG